MFVCTHILTVRTQVFLFKANYGTAVAKALFFHRGEQGLSCDNFNDLIVNDIHQNIVAIHFNPLLISTWLVESFIFAVIHFIDFALVLARNFLTYSPIT